MVWMARSVRTPKISNTFHQKTEISSVQNLTFKTAKVGNFFIDFC